MRDEKIPEATVDEVGQEATPEEVPASPAVAVDPADPESDGSLFDFAVDTGAVGKSFEPADGAPEADVPADEPEEEAEADDTENPLPVDGGAGQGDAPDSDDSGHIADIVSEGGESVDGALVWSASGRRFRIVPVDGSPLSEPETGQILSLLDSKRLAFDGAEEQSEFVDRMSERGVDVDNDRVAMDMDSFTGELLIDPELLTSNYRHHPSDGSETIVWPDEIDMDDPAMREAVEETPGGTGNLGEALEAASDGKEEKPGGGRHADAVMTVVAIAVVALFFVFVLIVQQPSAPVLAVWAIMCVAAALVLLMPLTLGRQGAKGSKAALAAGVTTVFALMLAGMMTDAVTSGRFPTASGGIAPGEVATGEGDETQTLDMSSPSDMAIVKVTGTGAEYPGVAVGGMLVTSGEVGQASSVTVSLAGKSYAVRRVMTIDRLGISVIEVDGDISPHTMEPAKSVAIGDKAIALSANGNGTITVEGVTVRGTTLSIGDNAGADDLGTFLIDSGFRAGTIIVNSNGKLLGILPRDGDEVTSGTAIAREAENMANRPASTPDDNARLPYIGISCRDAENDGGAYVESVEPGTPASNAGVMTRDIIRSINGIEINGVAEYEDVIRDIHTGERMSLSILRDGERDIVIEVEIP